MRTKHTITTRKVQKAPSAQEGVAYQRAIRKEWRKRSEQPLHTK